MPRKGVPHTALARQRISEAKKGVPLGPRSERHRAIRVTHPRSENSLSAEALAGARAARLKRGWHCISNVNEEAQTGMCSVCGPVSVKRMTNGARSWRCRTILKVWSAAHAKLPGTRERARNRQYGVDTGALWEAQKGLCALCEEPMTLDRKTEEGGQVDHDHSCCPGERSCGKCVRGYVHRRCNRLLGDARESPAILRAALGYLERFKLAREKLVPTI